MILETGNKLKLKKIYIKIINISNSFVFVLKNQKLKTKSNVIKITNNLTPLFHKANYIFII